MSGRARKLAGDVVVAACILGLNLTAGFLAWAVYLR